MGAWGTGYFEDDAALDFMADIEESKYPKQTIKVAFEGAIISDYLESDEGNAVIIAACYVARQANGAKFSLADDSDPLDVDTFPERNPDVDLSDLKHKAIEALQKVLGNNSELKELWEESGEYETWREGIEKLIWGLDN